jgi:hypothetical protein
MQRAKRQQCLWPVRSGIASSGREDDGAELHHLRDPLDTAHAVKVAFPTLSEVVVTNSLPGLESHIPPNTTITDIDGKPASENGITVSIQQPAISASHRCPLVRLFHNPARRRLHLGRRRSWKERRSPAPIRSIIRRARAWISRTTTRMKKAGSFTATAAYPRI